ncbi:MAG: DUF2298 domain-containing protein [Acidobacteriota bacterium]
MNWILEFVCWYLAVQLLSLLSLPLTWRLLHALPERGYCFNKTLGVLLGGYILWAGTASGLLRNEPGGAWLSLVLVALVSLLLLRQPRELWDWIRRQAKLIFTAEALFFAAFLAWAWIRSYDPAANHTEQPMDLMLLNAIHASPTFPPSDSWMVGYPISYYYFGAWMLNFLGWLSGVPTAVAYNLGQACWFGLLLLGSFGLGAILAETYGKGPSGSKPLNPHACGFLSALAVGVIGNLQILLELLHASGLRAAGLFARLNIHDFPPQQLFWTENWWWWRSSRILQDLAPGGEHIEVIDEFPIFSYILGDNHPHLLAMPFVILVIAMGLHLFLSVTIPETRQPAPGETSSGSWRRLAVLGLGSGALLFLNPWDYLPYLLLLVGCWVVARLELRTPGAGRVVRDVLIPAGRFGMLLVVFGLLFYLPFLLTAQSQVRGIAPNLDHPTYFPHFLVMFGVFFPGLILLVGLAWNAEMPSWRRLACWATAVFGLPLLFLVTSFVWAPKTQDGAAASIGAVVSWMRQATVFWAVGLLLVLIVSTPRWRGRYAFILLLAGLGLSLIWIPEFAYIRDSFGTRMNTVFKFYYQGWLLLGTSAAWATWAALRRGGLFRFIAVLSMTLMGIGLIYPVAAIYTKTNRFQRQQPTLNAVADLETQAPDEWEAIAWIEANIPAGATVLQALGASYRAEQNRVSTLTGRPTLLGWVGHELQWRGAAYGAMAAGRPEALKTIYRTGTSAEIEATLSRWRIDYVYVGPAERALYQITPQREQQLTRGMQQVFQNDTVVIYNAAAGNPRW